MEKTTNKIRKESGQIKTPTRTCRAVGLNDAEKWLKKLAGDRYVEPKEETEVLESWQYGNPESVLERKQLMKLARERKLKKGGGR